ncbi:protein kinase, putative [Leishmania panamensis]|uniref:Protein kinase, putative n=1 Tax=Leishmania panamensis TaxID=5679 RepID=A0A088S3Z8_LEIPA|nr:protein kinase, putative [Leishmania panamensis]AIN96146.1 protein kinase, putative [Leishmania panamensis]
MPPKKRKAVKRKAETTVTTPAAVAAAKKNSPKAVKKIPPKPTTAKKRAVQRLCTSPASRVVSKAATRKAIVVKATAAAAKVKPVRTPSSSGSHTCSGASSQHSTKTPESRQTAEKTAAPSTVRRKSLPSPSPPAATRAAAVAKPAPTTGTHRRRSTAKQPPQTNEELDDGRITSRAEENKAAQTDRKDAHDDTAAAPSRPTARTSTATRAAPSIVVVTVNENKSEDEDSDDEDTILFRSGVDVADMVGATRSSDGARQSHRDALPTLPHVSLMASTATAVEQRLVSSPEISPTHPLHLLHREAGGGGSSSATLDLRRCTTPPLQPTERGAESLNRQSPESSPEALMADSERKSSSHRWQRQLLASGTPATQHLLQENEKGEEMLQDDGDRHSSTSPVHATETVKQLFTQPARSISLTPTSADDSLNGTLIMGRGSEEDGLEETDAQALHQRQQQRHQYQPCPLGLSNIATRGDSESQWSVERGTKGPPLPPGSATAATSPRLPSLVPRDGSGTEEHRCGTSSWLLSTQSSALKDDEVLSSQQPKTAASVAPSFPAPAGHLRMGGNTSRQHSPSACSYAWLKQTPGGGVVEASHPAAPLPSATPSSFPTHPLFQQQQWLSYAYLNLSFTSPSSSQLTRLADMETTREADADVEESQPPTATTPQRQRRREPPVWRSPQITRLPKSLSVSPTSRRGDSREGAVKASAALPAAQLPSQTQPVASSASPASSSIGETTQTFTQASANAAGGSEAPLPVVPSGPTTASAASRPSTQLITKAAATRPIASPGTMWICLDDDDDNDSEGEDGVAEATRAVPLHNSSDSLLVSVKKEIDAEADGEKTDAVRVLSGHAAHSGTSASPSRSPRERGMAVGEGEQTEVYERLRSQCPSPSKTESGDAVVRVDQSSVPVSSPAQALRRPPAEKSHPIAEILPPTFRPRRRPPDTSADPALSLGTGSATQQRLSSGLGPHCYINLDDDTEEEDEDTNEAPPRQRTRDAPPSLALFHTSPVTGGEVHAQLSLPLIIDDDDDDSTPEGDGETHMTESGSLEVERDAISLKTPKTARDARVERANEVVANEEDDDGLLKSPQKPHVKDFIFPNRLDPGRRPSSPLYRSIHAYQQQLQQLAQGKGEEHAARRVAAAALLPQEGDNADRHHLPQTTVIPVATRDVTGTAADVAAAGQVAHKRSRAKSAKTEAAVSTPTPPDWGRPADALLRDFFPTKPTKRNFMEAARNVLSPMHFLHPGDFWAAFASAEFVGEGSFGLVWRCLTVDGDLVAVKSCPIILRTKANIEDSFSTIREIATMRFLNEMQVPYILPLHSAFFVHGQEALPPLAQEALDWHRQLRKRAEEAALEVEVQLLSRGGHRRASHTAAEENAEDALLTLEQQVAMQMERLASEEGPEERATRARLQSVRLPRFLSITHDDLIQSDATAFLVMELCDGDVEGIPRSDGIAKGVVYCVSSALAAMHELGLLHLDLKPSNILFAYEHGPSQQRLQPQQQFSASGTTMDAIKFYLSDFGNCRLVGPDPMDEVQDSYGTFEYMDLRALREAVCGRPTDAFSLGATLYELLYGRRLYPKCRNPRCSSDGDHSRECFVEVASQPVLLPTVGSPPAAAIVTPTTTIGLNAAAGGHAHGHHAQVRTSGNNSLNTNGPSLTPLQYLTLALLRQSWAERMAAEECRRYLVQTFNITQTEDVSP